MQKAGYDYSKVQKRVNEILNGGNAGSSTEYYTVVKGDSLWAIAQKYYGNGSLYPKIKKLNGLSSNVIYPGQKLRVR